MESLAVQFQTTRNSYAYCLLPFLAFSLPSSLMSGQLFSDNFTAGLQNHWAVVDEGTMSAPSKWLVNGGLLNQKSNIYGSDPLAQPGTYLLSGNSTWTDYSVAARVKTTGADNGAIGVMFGYRDAKNYYRFSMDRKQSRRRLVKVVNGLTTLLAEDKVAYAQKQWYAVEARMAAGQVEIWVDFKFLFQVTDASHLSGRIALYASDNTGAVFDDVVVNGGGPIVDPCTYAITPAQVEAVAGATSDSVAVTSPNGCSWSAKSNASWITITSGIQGTGDGVVNYSVSSYGGTASRQGSVTIAGLNFGVSQLGNAPPPQGNYVPPGGDLQKALDNAAPGATITLEPGATYTGHFYLRKKSGAQFITLTTADPGSLPPGGKRITPAYAARLPKIASPDDAPAISADAGAHHYRLVGIEIHAPNSYSYELIQLGSAAATQASQLPSDIELDRLYLHGDPRLGGKRGVTLNSAATIIRNCYFADFKGIGQDTQAIAGWNGPGPFEITNNYLEATGENILFGGAAPAIQGLVPSDIQIRKNHIYKKPAWCRFSSSFDGSSWVVKNSLELKMARRVTIEGNVIENNWAQAQAGYAIVFTVRANKVATWAVVEDVNFVRNIVRHSGSGVNILGKDNNSNYAGIARRILIKDNLFDDIDYTRWGGEGRAFQALTGAQDVTIDHNTVITNNLRMMVMLDGQPLVRFTYRNNIAPHGQSGVLGSGKGIGLPTLNYYAPGWVFVKNVLVGGASRAGLYPSNNFFPATYADVRFVSLQQANYALTSQSPYINAGTDGKSLGADIGAILTATAGVLVP